MDSLEGYPNLMRCDSVREVDSFRQQNATRRPQFICALIESYDTSLETVESTAREIVMNQARMVNAEKGAYVVLPWYFKQDGMTLCLRGVYIEGWALTESKKRVHK